MTDALTESVQRLVLMEADLAHLLAAPADQPDDASVDGFAELIARLVRNQRQIIETLIMISDEIASLRSNALVAAADEAVDV